MNKKPLPYIIFVCSFLLPLCIYTFISLDLKNWIVDDAGISFAYSRSLADGYGLVSQPGAERVEGYSNFLWVLIFAPFFSMNLFDPVITSKIVAAIFVGILFYLITKICIRAKKSAITGLIANSLIAINTPFIIWTASGLENSLYVLLITLMAFISLKYSDEKKVKLIVAGALAAFLISITRPDGIIFMVLFPIGILSSRVEFKKMVKPLLTYVLGITVLLSSFILFRWFYFHDVMPNTYYAKETHIGETIHEFLFKKGVFIKKYNSIFLSIGGIDLKYIVYTFVAILVLQIILLRKTVHMNVVLFAAWFLSLISYMLLPYDWMGYFRFATAFIVITNIGLVLIAVKTPDLFPRFKKPIKGLLIIFLLIYSWISFNDHHKRMVTFSKYPTVPFSLVKKLFADGFNRYADLLNIENGSILLPDVGATYFYSTLRVYDSAGLCDKTIARGKYTKNRKLIQEYIFTQIKPTFIHLQDGWAEMIRPDEYPNFRNEYIVIYETISEAYSNKFGENIYSGDYVRKDAINEQNQPALDKIIEERNQ